MTTMLPYYRPKTPATDISCLGNSYPARAEREKRNIPVSGKDNYGF